MHSAMEYFVNGLFLCIVSFMILNIDHVGAKLLGSIFLIGGLILFPLMVASKLDLIYLHELIRYID